MSRRGSWAFGGGDQEALVVSVVVGRDTPRSRALRAARGYFGLVARHPRLLEAFL